MKSNPNYSLANQAIKQRNTSTVSVSETLKQ